MADQGSNTIVADRDKIAGVRIALGLEPYGALPDDEDQILRRVLADIVDAALVECLQRPDRIKLLFERERNMLKLLAAVAEELGYKNWLSFGDDVKATRISERVRARIDEWKKTQETGEDNAKADPTLMAGLLHINYTIEEQLSRLDRTPQPK